MSQTSAWELGRKVDEKTAAELTELAKAPARVAAAYGKMTGNCCFCTSTLSNEKSTDVGYGPVCADRFDLPWGKKMLKQPLVAETVEPKWEPKPSTEAKINDANVMLQLCETIKTAPKPAEPANRAMMELFAKFGGDGEALQVLNKLAQLAATEKAA